MQNYYFFFFIRRYDKFVLEHIIRFRNLPRFCQILVRTSGARCSIKLPSLANIACVIHDSKQKIPAAYVTTGKQSNRRTKARDNLEFRFGIDINYASMSLTIAFVQQLAASSYLCRSKRRFPCSFSSLSDRFAVEYILLMMAAVEHVALHARLNQLFVTSCTSARNRGRTAFI